MTTFELDVALPAGAISIEVALRIEAKALALCGPSGAGKSSVLEAIAGLRTPTRGRIVLGGHTLFDAATGTNVPPRDRSIGYVPQDVLLFPHLTVQENVTYARPSRLLVPLDDLVDLFELGSLMTRRVPLLSGGERQRVALARALYAAPRWLLLDEPLAAIDLGRRARILDALVHVRDGLGVPFVYVTHAPEEASRVASHAVVLDQGTVMASGEVRDVLERVDTRGVERSG